jgi:hypothetical protein
MLKPCPKKIASPSFDRRRRYRLCSPPAAHGRQRPGPSLGRREVGPVRRHPADQLRTGYRALVLVGDPRTPLGGDLLGLLAGDPDAGWHVGQVEQAGIVLPVRSHGTDRLEDVGPSNAGEQERLDRVAQDEVLHLTPSRVRQGGLSLVRYLDDVGGCVHIVVRHHGVIKFRAIDPATAATDLSAS